MKRKILFVYKWATMGGVERVMLNRALKLLDMYKDLSVSICFLQNGPGYEQIKKIINQHYYKERFDIVDQIKHSEYDLFFVIDTPEVICDINPKKLFVECHTSYSKNREYLKDVPSSIQGIIAPSNSMVETIANEVSTEFKPKVFRLSNDIGYNINEIHQSPVRYTRTPVFYLGRLDTLKNVEEVMRIVSQYNDEVQDDLMIFFVGDIIEHEINFEGLLRKYHLMEKYVYLPQISFDKTSSIMKMIRENKGLFLSASHFESFALSAAEAMYSGIPVLLFYNEAHAQLVQFNEDYLFTKGDYADIFQKIKNIINFYEAHEKVMLQSIEYFDHLFEDDWMSNIHPILYT